MLALIGTVLAVESLNNEGVIQFDALQTTPGTSTASFLVCLVNCANTAVQNNLIASIVANGGGIAAGQVVIACAGACSVTSRARSLLQVVGSSGTIQISGATVAQLQILQNNINAGNLVNVGISPTTVVSAPGVAPNGPATALVPLVPANPASPAAAAVCATAANQRLACVVGTSTVTAIQACASTQASIFATSSITTVCCPCTNGYQVTAVTSGTTLAQLCRAAPTGYRGCGKRGSKKGLLGLLGLLGLIPLCLCLLICCLCCLRRKRRGQAMLFSQTAVPAPIPAPLPPVALAPMGPDFHVHP